MPEIRIYFPDGDEKVLFHHSDETVMARVFTDILETAERSKDPEQRFNLELVRDGKVGVVHCDEQGKIVEVQWLRPDVTRVKLTQETFQVWSKQGFVGEECDSPFAATAWLVDDADVIMKITRAQDRILGMVPVSLPSEEVADAI